MKGIKKKETRKDIKLFDKRTNGLRHVKRAEVRTKDVAGNLIDDGKITPSEYVEDQMKYTAEDSARGAFDLATKRGRLRKQRRIRSAAKTKARETKAAQKTEKGIKQTGKKIEKAVKKAFDGLTALVGAGGAVAIVAVIIICGVGIIFGSAFGIFFSGERSSGRSMDSVVREINAEYNERLQKIKEENEYDVVEMSGSSAVWREVLAFYAVRTSMADENRQEVVTLDQEKIELLRENFWEMNTISSEVRTETKNVVEEKVGEDGKIIEVVVEKQITTLYITVSHLNADEMAVKYGFTEEQKDTMHSLLSDEYRAMWGAVLYGVQSGDTAIIEVAASQLGNVGGEPLYALRHIDLDIYPGEFVAIMGTSGSGQTALFMRRLQRMTAWL